MATLIEKWGWHEWLCKTNFSFLMGASHPEEILLRAQTCGYRACALTIWMESGLARTYIKHRDLTEPGFELRYGIEIHLSQDHDHPLLLQDTLVLVAQSFRGYSNICKINNYAHRESKDKAFILLDDLLTHDVADVVALQPMRGHLRSPILTRNFVLKNSKGTLALDFFYAVAATCIAVKIFGY
ncbi:MAG: PHP domain-containing protein [Bdellovibrionales bacterium]